MPTVSNSKYFLSLSIAPLCFFPITVDLLGSEHRFYGGKSEAAFAGGGEVKGPKVLVFTCEMVPIFKRLIAVCQCLLAESYWVKTRSGKAARCNLSPSVKASLLCLFASLQIGLSACTGKDWVLCPELKKNHEFSPLSLFPTKSSILEHLLDICGS